MAPLPPPPDYATVSISGLYLVFANLRTLGAQIHSVAHPNNPKIQNLSILRPGDAHPSKSLLKCAHPDEGLIYISMLLKLK